MPRNPPSVDPPPAFLAEDHLSPTDPDPPVVLDLRPAMAFMGGHLPGSLHLPPPPRLEALLPRVFPGGAIPVRDLVLLVQDADAGRSAADAIAAAGFAGAVRGLLPASALGAWARCGGKLEIVPQVTLEEAVDGLEAGILRILDVRGADAVEAGRIPGSAHLPMDQLAAMVWTRVPDHGVPDGPVAVVSQRGVESPVAAGLLQRMGIKEVWDVAGGFQAWRGP